ncbi:MAG: hypothetical protein AAGN82_02240 [Myxococcota bacterium]
MSALRPVSLVVLALASCDPVPVPEAERFPPAQPRTAATFGAAASAPPAATSAPPSPAPPSEAPSATASGTGAAAAPPSPDIFAADGSLLPQTEEEPRTDDPRFEQNVARLWRAIVSGEPDVARSFFFPVEAYERVKAIKDPAKDWRHRLYGNFERDVKDYHRRLGKHRDEAKFLRLDVRNKPEWMKVGREGNLVGYHRVTRSLLYYEDHKGRERELDVTSMISWRGQWFVVHLHGFE